LNPSLDGVLRALARRIGARPHADGLREARVLVGCVTGLDAAGQIAAGDRSLSEAEMERLEALVTRREKGEPLARLLGRAPFWDFEVGLNGQTLIPRDDSEVLVRAALERLPADQPSTIVDVGTGSGILLLALSRERAMLNGLGIDLSIQAVAQAEANASALSLSDRLRFVQGNWLEGVQGPLDMVISNPPYIAVGEMEYLEIEVRLHDPALALVGGADGLDAYRALLPQAQRLVRPGGHVLMEIGHKQAAAVILLGQAAGLQADTVLADLGGQDRVVAFCRP
jgi:release factor glutamine methyltransferase